jgi:hypothetical protein
MVAPSRGSERWSQLHLQLPESVRIEAARQAVEADLTLAQWVRAAIREKLMRGAR